MVIDGTLTRSGSLTSLGELVETVTLRVFRVCLSTIKLEFRDTSGLDAFGRLEIKVKHNLARCIVAS